MPPTMPQPDWMEEKLAMAMTKKPRDCPATRNSLADFILVLAQAPMANISTK